MRRWPLALLVLLSAPALAQDTAPAATPAPAEPTPAPTPAPAAPTPAPTPAPAETTPAPAAAQPPAAAPPPAARKPPQAAATPPAAAPVPPTARPPTPPTPSTAGTVHLGPGREAARPTEEDLSPEGIARSVIHNEARFLFQSLLTGDVRTASTELIFPFQLEDKRFNTPDELVQAWVKQLRARRTDLITLYDIEVLPIAEMEKKYGKPPARLGLDPRALKDTWAAVGNLSGHAAIFLFRGSPDLTWHAFAYTD
ncbi:MULTISPECIES: hypothetical protein [unclassified Corallococcus]|uniref:hypothetical protein n=1 Tax=unclassified Corallococcus TaxID=2685029 RepID=UPI001A8E2C58|nr:MULTISPECIES: hypothetical protein [unclassified Corallococcus]MBN9686074.1 hypothetical protein [Corallococcus sp. NCSPR001]WAS82490.1 hypothetical protein O0N60_24540 [Corallococcus sp. NCRR]